MTLICGALLDPWLPPSEPTFLGRKYVQVFRPTATYNALVLGASVQAHGLDPWRLNGDGLRWYNFAYNGSGPAFWLAWYALYRRHAPAPRVVLLPVDWYTLTAGSDRALEHDVHYMPLDEAWRLWCEPGTDHGLLLGNVLALTRSRDVLQQAFPLVHLAPYYTFNEALFHDGYIPYHNPRHPTTGPQYVPGVVEELVTAYRALLARLAGEHVRVVLLRMPEWQPPAGDHRREAAEVLQRLGVAEQEVLDYTGQRGAAFSLDGANFADWHHLGEAGSQRFSRQLAADLRELSVYRLAPGG